MADNESPAFLSKYQTCLFSSEIPTVTAFENSQTASFEFEVSPSADLQALSFIPSPAQRPHAPANRNSHDTVSQEETPSYFFLKIFFPPVFLSNASPTAPTRGKVVDSKACPNPAVEIIIFGRAVTEVFSHSIDAALAICEEEKKSLLNGPNAIRKFCLLTGFLPARC